MGYTIPTIEPVSVRAGDSWKWTKTLFDYPASTWTLTYTFWNASATFSATASASGADHAVSVAPATTAGYTAGRYEWVARVTDGTDSYTVGKGTIQVQPKVGTAMDTRTHARKMLDLIEAVQLGRATDDDLDTLAVAYNGRNLQRDPGLLSKEYQRWATAVAQEEQAAKIARGDSTGRLYQVRFRR